MVAGSKEQIDLWVRSEGVVYWCDVTVTETGCPSIVERAAREAGSAVHVAEGKKVSKYRKFAERDGATVVPFGFETTGRRGVVMEKFLKRMEAISSTGKPLTSLWLQLSVTMAKMNVSLLRQAVRYATTPRDMCGRRRRRGYARRALAG